MWSVWSGGNDIHIICERVHMLWYMIVHAVVCGGGEG